MPKKCHKICHKVLPLNEQLNALDFIRKEKKLYDDVVKNLCKNKYFIHEILKKEIKVC